MPEIVLGVDVPYLRVILQSGAVQKLAIKLLVEAEDLVGIEARLDLGEESHVAVLDDTTYTWSLDDEDVAKVTNRSAAVLGLENAQGFTVLSRGIVEVR